MGLVLRFDPDGKFITPEEWEKNYVEVTFVSVKTELAEIVERLEKLDEEVVLNVANLFKSFLEEKPSDPAGTAFVVYDEDDWGDEE